MKFFNIILLSILSFKALCQEDFSIFLIGDAGETYFANSTVQDLLKQELIAAGPNSTIIFLGDNIYPRGMPSLEDDKERDHAENALNAQLNILEKYKGQVFFIPGNHDWSKGKENGLARIKNQETFVESYLQNRDSFLPGNGCPGPVLLDLTENTLLIIYDSQWLLHPFEKSTEQNGCKSSTEKFVLNRITELINENLDKRIVIAAHHPFITYGIHGGVTTFKDHVFPLTVINKALYIPLPIIGSIYPLARKSGNIQDTNHKKYKNVINTLHPVFKNHGKVIHVAGHEHSLQHNYFEGVNYIVSGAGVKTTHVKKKGSSLFAIDETGFAKLNFKSRSVTLEFFSPNDSGKPIVYTKEISKLFSQ